ncbi:MAG: hypothetical protein WBF89_14860 [Steroidobacteraceae bacterium]|jgi:hypothetical protein
MPGAQFRALLETQAEQLFALTGAIAECQRKFCASDAGPLYDGIFSSPSNEEIVGVVHSEFGLDQLRIENQILTGTLRTAEALCRHDIVLASLIHVWIDEARRRAWILFQSASKRPATAAGLPPLERVSIASRRSTPH